MEPTRGLASGVSLTYFVKILYAPVAAQRLAAPREYSLLHVVTRANNLDTKVSKQECTRLGA